MDDPLEHPFLLLHRQHDPVSLQVQAPDVNKTKEPAFSPYKTRWFLVGRPPYSWRPRYKPIIATSGLAAPLPRSWIDRNTRPFSAQGNPESHYLRELITETTYL
ncbi:hypothetical protein ElyMa_005074000 [Elysia marginata]|uniref:Uncharacterized protein n=1 Tax=Elysia marginata TaxID=1093978 RepID=A0AAV4JGU6_9GAST|nr:hypothetical protein ElyMa_005074000 [Elysia marginata]